MAENKFNLRDIKRHLTLSLLFMRPELNSPLLDLYLAGGIEAEFDIFNPELNDFKHEDRALICDRIMLQPSKVLQKYIGKKLTFDEIKEKLGTDFAQDKVDELIAQFLTKLNLIYNKQKLYGQTIKNFKLKTKSNPADEQPVADKGNIAD